MMKIFLVVPLVLLIGVSIPIFADNVQKPCKLKVVNNNGGKVCVCDDTYCDTIPKVQKTSKFSFVQYTSDKSGRRFERSYGKFAPLNLPVFGQYKIKINSRKKFQKVVGWGGAFTDATGYNIKKLNQSAQDLLLEAYFGDNGIEYDTCRVPIGGTDFSPRKYTYDDTVNNTADPELLHWALQAEDYEYKIPFMKKAKELRKGNLKFFGSNWGAPAWIRTDNTSNSAPIAPEYYQTWANYFLKFLLAYKEQGLEFWGVTTQNEPSLAYLGLKNIQTVGWNSVKLADWIKNNLGPTIRNSTVNNTIIMILDDQKPFIPWYTNSVLYDKDTRKYVSGIAIHWYFGMITPCEEMVQTSKDFPEIFIISTEACNGFEGSSGVSLGSWERGEDYSSDIIEDMSCQVVGWVDWNMVLDLQGGPTYINNTVDAPIIVDPKNGVFYKQSMYYHLGHYSKFAPVNSVRIETKLVLPDGVKAVGYERPDKGIVIVILNRSEQDVLVKIEDSKTGYSVVKINKRSINTVLYW